MSSVVPYSPNMGFILNFEEVKEKGLWAGWIRSLGSEYRKKTKASFPRRLYNSDVYVL